MQHGNVELAGRTNEAVEIAGANVEATAAAGANVFKAEAVLNGDARRGNGVSETDVSPGSDGDSRRPAPTLRQSGRGEGGIPAQALDLPFSDDAVRFGESHLLEESNVGRRRSKVLPSSSPTVGIDRVNGEEAVLAEVGVSNGGGRLATRRFLDGSTGGGRPLVGGDGAMPRISALQRARTSAALPTDPAFSTTEATHGKGRVGREKVLEGQHHGREASNVGPCR